MNKQQTETKTILNAKVAERAVLYARVSGDDRKQEGRNLANQLEMGREYADQNGYHIIAEIKEDEGKFTSGADVDLPGLTRVRDMAEQGLFDVLIVRELDRLSRRLAKQVIVENELKNNGIRIEYVIGEYPNTPEGNLQKNFKAMIAEYEREKIKERVIRGKRNVAKSDKVVRSSKPPYGYDFSEDGYSLVIVDSEAKTIVLIFELYLNGRGTQAIADYLNKHGFATPKGGNKWNQSTISYILKNKTYIGKWAYGKMSRVEVKGSKKWVKNSNHIEVTCPAIISEDVFNAAQQQLKDNRKYAKRNTKREYLMSGRIKCQCGTAVLVHSANPYFYYKCDARRRPKKHGHTCDLPTFTVKEVDTIVWAKLEEYILNPQKLKAEMKEYQQKMGQVAKPLENRLKIVDDLIAEQEGEFDNAAQNMRLAKGDKAKALFADDLDRIEKVTASLKNEREEIVARLEAETLTDKQIDDTLEFAAAMAKDWQEVSQDFESKRAFLNFIGAELTLLVVEGKRKGLLTAKIGTKPFDLCFDNSKVFYPGEPGRPWRGQPLPPARRGRTGGKSRGPDNRCPAA